MHFKTLDTLIDGQCLHPEANGYAKRLLTDLQAPALGLGQFRAVFFHEEGGSM